MSLLEKIIYVADYIEPARYRQPNLEILRDLAYNDIDRALAMILRDTLDYLNKSDRSSAMDTNTVEAAKFYKSLLEV